jgi:2-amino-4-hydroxy-6-hydroxymethyldihydropteridine diphosphokinase
MEDLTTVGLVFARSSLYCTAPVGSIDQPPFVNAVVLLETALDPEGLLEFLLATERCYGRDRVRELPKGPRTLDLDLLMMNDLVLQTPLLTLPHPALAERRFVLAPLAEIVPELRHPVLNKTMAELLAALPDEGANRVENVRKIEVDLEQELRHGFEDETEPGQPIL